MTQQKPTLAICYDFDGTLIEGNMQENSFIPQLGVVKDKFWQSVKENAEDNDMDEVLAYMQLMLKGAQNKNIEFNENALSEHGENVKLFPGVKDWFSLINKYSKQFKLNIQHYVISSGIDAMIEGSPIKDEFQHIYASGFVYDANGVAIFPARSINYTTKVQYLFRINKGIENSWDNTDINKFTEEKDRPIPFSQMIYIGDGETDVPTMKMLNYKGGYSIAVYPPEKEKNAESLQQENRCQFIAEADYSKGKTLYKIVTKLIDRIASEIDLKMNLKA